MLEIKESFRRSTQVLVVGGGPAGIAAAVSAAREGAKVMLAESGGCLGGAATLALVGPFMTCYDGAGKHQVIRGFYEELVRRMEKEGGAIHPSKCDKYSTYSAYRDRGHSNVGPFNSDTLKLVAEEMCVEAGVELLYQATLIDVLTEEEKIAGGVFAVSGGVGVIEAEMVIDCTGNGDAAYLSGAPTEKPEDVQPATMFFIVDGVDRDEYEALKAVRPKAMTFWDVVTQLYDSGEYPIPKKNIALYESCDGTWRANMTRVNGVDATDPFEVTRASIELRRQIPIAAEMMKKHIPICKNLRVVSTANQPGFRESRRIVGDFVLDAEDMKNSVVYEDNIALCSNSFDMHVGDTVQYIVGPENPYGIPYRSLLPQKIKNLLVAGRCISCTRDALAAIRVMPPCFAMGQAAGVAAALALKGGCEPAKIDTAALQDRLRAQGAVVTYEDIDRAINRN